MMRSVFSRVLWLARGTSVALGLVVMLAVVLGVGTMALAAVPGDPFKLGQVNSINKLTTLAGTVTSPMLRVENKGTGTALDLRVQPDKPPMTTNSTGRIPKLNADMVDGKHANAFLPTGGKAADADKLDGKDSTAFWSGDTYTKNTSVRGQSGQFTNASLSCDGGDVMLSGGYDFPSSAGYTVSVDTVYYGTYYLTWYTPSNYGGQQARAYAHCADLGSPR